MGSDNTCVLPNLVDCTEGTKTRRGGTGRQVAEVVGKGLTRGRSDAGRIGAALAQAWGGPARVRELPHSTRVARR